MQEILFHQSQKISLLNDMLCIERKISALLKALDDIENLIESENEIINKINLCDFNISRVNDELKKRGLYLNSKVLKENSKEPFLLNYFSNIKKIKSLLEELSRIKESNILEMEQIACNYKNDADDLDKIDKIKKLISKDLQFF
jgi:2-phosphoglycerate kinase